MIQKIRHVGIVVQDLQKAKTFWTNLMKFEVISEALEQGSHLDKMMGLSNVNVTTCKMKSKDGQMLELLKFSNQKYSSVREWQGTPFSTGLTHVAFTVDDLDQLYNNRARLGLTFSEKPQLSPDGKVKVSYCRGPENMILELVEEL